MKRTSAAWCSALVMGVLAGSVALAQPGVKEKPAKPVTPTTPAAATPGTTKVPAAPAAPVKGQPEITGVPEGMQLPEGWTQEDMMACMQASTPGEQHAMLAKEAGTWSGKSTMWMGPTSEGVVTQSSSVVTSIMDGRYMHIEWSGEMPGAGPYMGSGLVGFDNVSQKYFATWIDNMGTGLMVGEGQASADGKTMTINYKYNCPITKKPTTMREVETVTGANSKTIEMFTTDPKSGKEYRMMKSELTREG